jgi:hypothetical protein
VGHVVSRPAPSPRRRWPHPPQSLTRWLTPVPPTTPPQTQVFCLPPLPHPSLPSSIVAGNGSALPVTSVGDAVLPSPFRLSKVLVAPHIIQNLLSVRQFTTDNSCSMEFDSFGLSVKDLATTTLLARCDSPGRSTHFACLLPLHRPLPHMSLQRSPLL